MKRVSTQPILALVLGALFLSGVAAIINQIVWQRALKVYLAGSEAISSMIVVLVFMLGLGLGSFHMGRAAQRVKNPLKMLAVVEIMLLAVNLVICVGLSLDVATSANELQRAAVAIGLPLRVLYAIVSAVTLMVPCYLMGITMPLVSEASQRQLRSTDSRFLTVLFFLNTLGAVAGGLASGFYLMPYLGQQKSLVLAALLNGLAGVVLLVTRAIIRPSVSNAEEPGSPSTAPGEVTVPRRISWSVLAWAFGLGFLALAYEMYLFRVAALAFQPLPFTFAAVLCTYLFIWSVGVYAARYFAVSFSAVLWITACAVALSPQVLYFRLFQSSFNMFLAVQCLPCFGFGLAFGRIIAKSARNWGNDVGRFYFFNTIGSAAGILVSVLAGYRVHPMFLGWGIFLGYGLLAASATNLRWLDTLNLRSRVRLYAAVTIFALVWITSAAWLVNALRLTNQPDSPDRMYFSPEGVVSVQNAREMYWDGLWHSDLSRGDHVGTNNWLLGMVPLLAHGGGDALDVLVVGLGTGITVNTLAQFPQVREVGVYEINPSLQQVLQDFPDGTLRVADNPKVNIKWGDGRTGLALDPKKYDIITQQPMYLMQAGSSILLSREYMQLVKQRLKPGGVFAIYCNSMGNFGQAAVVRKTADAVFDYCESFGEGYMLLVSDSPIAYSREKLDDIAASLPEVSPVRSELSKYGTSRLAEYLDNPRLNWAATSIQVTDDRPIVEYPEILRKLVPRPRTRGGWAR